MKNRDNFVDKLGELKPWKKTLQISRSDGEKAHPLADVEAL